MTNLTIKGREIEMAQTTLTDIELINAVLEGTHSPAKIVDTYGDDHFVIETHRKRSDFTDSLTSTMLYIKSTIQYALEYRDKQVSVCHWAFADDRFRICFKLT